MFYICIYTNRHWDSLFKNQKLKSMKINIQHVYLFEEKSESEIKNNYSKKLKKNEQRKIKKRNEFN